MSPEHQHSPVHHPEHQSDEPDLRIDGHEAAEFKLPWYLKLAITPVPMTTNRWVMMFWLCNQLGMHLSTKRAMITLVAMTAGSWFAVAICKCEYFAATLVAVGMYVIWDGIVNREAA